MGGNFLNNGELTSGVEGMDITGNDIQAIGGFTTMTGCSNASVDFTTSAPIYTIPYLSNAPRKMVGAEYMMWSGDANNNKNVKYNGLSTDKDQILQAVGASTPNNSLSPVYRMEDVNMDAKVRYNNANNDRMVILENFGVSSPNTIINQHTPN